MTAEINPLGEIDLEFVQNLVPAGENNPGTPSNNNYVFANKQEAEDADIPLIISMITIAGLITSGDGKGGNYARLVVAPNVVTSDHLQTADGSWWKKFTNWETVTKIFYGMGQSNTEIRRPYNWKPEKNLFVWNHFVQANGENTVGNAIIPMYNNYMNPLFAYANEYAKEHPNQKVVVIIQAYGGIPIEHWLPGGTGPNMWDVTNNNFLAMLAVLGEPYDLEQWTWHGESNVINGTVQDMYNGTLDWVQKWEQFRQRLRTETTWYPYDTPAVLHTVSPYTGYSSRMTLFNKLVAKAAALDPTRTSVVDLSKIPRDPYYTASEGYIHMEAAGYEIAGKISYEQTHGVGKTLSSQGAYVNLASGTLNLLNRPAWKYTATASITGPLKVSPYAGTTAGEDFQQVNAFGNQFDPVTGSVNIFETGLYLLGFQVRNGGATPLKAYINKTGGVIIPGSTIILNDPGEAGNIVVPAYLTMGTAVQLVIVSGTTGQTIATEGAATFWGIFLG